RGQEEWRAVLPHQSGPGGGFVGAPAPGSAGSFLQGHLRRGLRGAIGEGIRCLPARAAWLDITVIEELANRELRALKARAQLLKPMLKVGKEGLSPAFLKAVDE